MEMLSKLKLLLSSCVDHFLPILRLGFRCYSRISDSKHVCYIAKLYTVIIFIFSTSGFLYWHRSTVISILLATQYCVHAIYSFVTSDKQAFRFHRSVKTSDAIMGFKNLPYISKPVLVPIYITVLLWMFYVYYFWIDDLHLSTYIMTICSDLNTVTVGILLIGVFSRMPIMKIALENNFVPVNIVGKDQLQKNVKIVRKCVGYYSNLLDSFDVIHTQFQFTVSDFMKCASCHYIVQ
ncbi:hypothetical protein B5X24_HaOG200956 [Helicoverpa armigera]|nr:hypothetical protein B5X24_HaOG200956 [Helicoverpa armigera]